MRISDWSSDVCSSDLDAAGDEVAAAFTPSTENAFDAAVQGATADDALATPAASEWTTVTVRPGQTLSDIFDEEGLGFSAAMAIANLGGDASQLKTLRPGEKLSLRKTDDDEIGRAHV